MTLCKFANIFGAPNTGIHSTRILGLAFYDILFTVIAAFIYAYYYNKVKNTIKYTITLWIIGIIMHLIFCVKTPITKSLI
jgi:hypothetical protein